MRIGAAHSGGHDSCSARAARREPRTELRIHEEGRRSEINLRIRSRIIEAWRNLPVLQCEDGFDQSRHARRGVEMSDIRLHRADGAEARPLRRGAECLRERAHLDRIADWRARAVRLNVADAVRIHVGIRERLDDRIGLTVHARCRVAGFLRAVVVDRGAFDDRANGVAVGERIAESFQHDDAAAAAEDRSICVRIECAHMSIR